MAMAQHVQVSLSETMNPDLLPSQCIPTGIRCKRTMPNHVCIRSDLFCLDYLLQRLNAKLSSRRK